LHRTKYSAAILEKVDLMAIVENKIAAAVKEPRRLALQTCQPIVEERGKEFQNSATISQLAAAFIPLSAYRCGLRRSHYRFRLMD
jgi:hypothetical protein